MPHENPLLDGVTAVVEVKLSYIVSVAVDPGQTLVGDDLKRVVLGLTQDRIDAAGGLEIGDVDAVKILEIRDTNDDRLIIGQVV